MKKFGHHRISSRLFIIISFLIIVSNRVSNELFGNKNKIKCIKYSKTQSTLVSLAVAQGR